MILYFRKYKVVTYFRSGTNEVRKYERMKVFSCTHFMYVYCRPYYTYSKLLVLSYLYEVFIFISSNGTNKSSTYVYCTGSIYDTVRVQYFRKYFRK